LDTAASPHVMGQVDPVDTNQRSRRISATPRDLQQDPRSCDDLDLIHPERLSRVHATIHDIGRLGHSNLELSQLQRTIETTDQFIRKSETGTKAFKRRNDPLSRT